MVNELDTLIAELAVQRGLEQPRQDAAGRFFLLLDGELELGLVQHGDRIVIEGRLGPVPSDPVRAEALLVRVLKDRFARLKRRREVLSIDPEDGELVLFIELAAPALALTGLERGLAALAGSLEYWHEQLARDTAPVMPSPAMRVLYP